MPMVESPVSVVPVVITELAAAARGIFDGFDARSLRILRDRILAFESQSTLDELGQEFKLTRERVRQIEVAILKKIDNRLEFQHFACIKTAAKSLANELGLAIPKKRFDDLSALAMSSSAFADHPLLIPLLLWIGGPYALSQDWIVRKPVSDTMDQIRSCLPEPGKLDSLYEVEERLKGIGVSAGNLQQLISHLDYRVLGESVLSWRGSLADKAFGILTNTGNPMTREEISSAIGEEHSIRTLTNYLFDDERFVRINLTDFALAVWGNGKYKGIIKELNDEILRSGGEATLDHLRRSLMERFGVSERSIISYLASPLFARTTRGGFRVRREDEDVSVQFRVQLTRSCFLINQGWAYRLLIDDELIRGSGRNVPSGFAQAIGISPGGSSVYASEQGDYRIGWIGPQPTVGSIRKFIEAFGLEQGDWLYLAPTIKRIDVFAIRAGDLHELSNIDSLFRQTCPGQDLSSEDRKGAIAVALGLSENDSWLDIKRRLLERKESSLYALVPEEDGNADESAMLASLFDYIGSEEM
jgi:hypothetical protein